MQKPSENMTDDEEKAYLVGLCRMMLNRLGGQVVLKANDLAFLEGDTAMHGILDEENNELTLMNMGSTIN